MPILQKYKIARILLLSILYFLTGKLGLLLAVPPGYATIIWPPSGIAIGMLIIYGWRLWPGILIGSFALNLEVSGAYSMSGGFIPDKTFTAFIIACGSTVQAVASFLLTRRFIGLPLSFKHIKDVVLFLLIAGPVSCVIAATVGISCLYFSGVLPIENAGINWMTWWLGDTFGVALFLPLVLITPASRGHLLWRGAALSVLPTLAVFALIIPIGLTFYAWKIVSENVYKQSLSDFNTLASESEKALLYKIDSYNSALLGGAGFFQGSTFVSRSEWRSYAKAIDIKQSFPGINGIGYIAKLDPTQIDSFLKRTREDGEPGFKIHPETDGGLNYIITYIEPLEGNRLAMGLNIAFEENRLEAANLSRDTAKSAISKRVNLVQDEQKMPGFLLLYPIYKQDALTNTVEERREAINGWIYAPFIAKNFFKDLTHNQNNTLQVRIYDGIEEDPEKLIFSSDETLNSKNKPMFSIKKKLDVMQQKWLVVWESTPLYERSMQKTGPLIILVGGLLFTAILAIFLMVLSIRSAETLQWMVEDNKMFIPFLIFSISAIASLYLYYNLKEREENYVRAIIEEEAKKIQELVTFQTNDKLTALKRMAQRWVSAKGTPHLQWKDDARNYTEQLSGLKAVEWVDLTYHVRWVYPEKGNERAVGLNVVFDETRKKALEGAAERDAMTITPPIDLVQGYKAFIAYVPLKIDSRFDGFIVGIFAIDEFLGDLISREITGKYAVSISHDDKLFYKSSISSDNLRADWALDKKIDIYDKKWVISIVPKESFLLEQFSALPVIVLFTSFLISLLLALTVRYILISKIKSQYLQNSEETFRSAIEYASTGMALVGLDGKWLRVNPALCKIIDYSVEELIGGLDFQTITHPDDLQGDMNSIKELLDGKIHSYQMEKRYIRKDGAIIWVHLSVSLARKPDGTPKYFVSQIQDITERREMEQVKNDFISVVSHELRTPLTSIKGSLGLIEGTMTKEIPEKVHKLISIAHNNASRLILMVNDILDIDKLSAGQMRFDMKPEKIKNLVELSVEANIPYAEKHGISYVVEYIPENTHIYVDSGRFIQVISNLLSNAAKFSPSGAEVVISAAEKNNAIRISVTDKGPGIPDEFRARIFSKFSQSDSVLTRKQGGSGLGLFISRQMIERMHGFIGFTTETGKGSTFWIELPIHNIGD